MVRRTRCWWNRMCTVDRPVRPMRGTSRAPLVLISLALAACAAQSGASPDESTPATPDETRPVRSAPEPATPPPSDAPVTGEVPDGILADLVADAAQRADVDSEAVRVVQAVQVTWNDGSLGCPEPGMSYTMALVEGFHVILEAGDEELDYRVSSNGGFRLCENGGRPSG